MNDRPVILTSANLEDANVNSEFEMHSLAVTAIYELLSGVGTASLWGSSWLPTDHPAEFCARYGCACTFISLDDPLLKQKVAELKDKGVAIFISVQGPFGGYVAKAGYEKATRAIAEGNTEVFQEVLDSALKDVFQATEEGADVVVVADEICSNEGLLADPDFIETFLLDAYAQMRDNAEAMGSPAVFHSDGDITSYYPALAKAGFSGVHISMGAQPLDIGRAFAEASQVDLTPIGGIARDLIGTGFGEILSQHVYNLTKDQLCILTDDGGLSTDEDMQAYGNAMLSQ